MLMAREYVPEAGRIGTRMVRTANGLGVDRIDLRTLPLDPGRAAQSACQRLLSATGAAHVRDHGGRRQAHQRRPGRHRRSIISIAPAAAATGSGFGSSTATRRRA